MDDDASALEEYLRTAEIDLYGTFAATAGGGHPSKEFVLVRGGIGALAKLATTDDEARQCKSEVGAYVLAHLLGWDDLVPATVLREVPTSEGWCLRASKSCGPRSRPHRNSVSPKQPSARSTPCGVRFLTASF